MRSLRHYLALRIALLRAESNTRLRLIGSGVALAITSGALAVIAVVFGLLSLVKALQTMAELSPAAAFALVGAGVLGVALLVARAALKMLRRALQTRSLDK